MDLNSWSNRTHYDDNGVVVGLYWFLLAIDNNRAPSPLPSKSLCATGACVDLDMAIVRSRVGMLMVMKIYIWLIVHMFCSSPNEQIRIC